MLAERLSPVLDDIERAAGEVGKHARQECANLLNQALRRLWQASDPAGLADTLADAAAQFAGGAAVLSIEDGAAKLESVRPSGYAVPAPGDLTALDAAPALASAIESREPVIAAAAESEVGETLAALAASAGDDRMAVLPVASRGGVLGLVCAWGTVEAAAIELLAKVAGEEWERLARAAVEAAAEAAEAEAEAAAAAAAAEAEAAAAAAAELVTIAPVERSWDSLPAEDRRIHLRAQRFARVRVAQWRLRDGAAVRSGRARGDLYGGLEEQIEEARKGFHDEFFAQCPSMVDYLHLEMVHTLANDNAELLGKNYPGPLL